MKSIMQLPNTTISGMLTYFDAQDGIILANLRRNNWFFSKFPNRNENHSRLTANCWQNNKKADNSAWQLICCEFSRIIKLSMLIHADDEKSTGSWLRQIHSAVSSSIVLLLIIITTTCSSSQSNPILPPKKFTNIISPCGKCYRSRNCSSAVLLPMSLYREAGKNFLNFLSDRDGRIGAMACIASIR